MNIADLTVKTVIIRNQEYEISLSTKCIISKRVPFWRQLYSLSAYKIFMGDPWVPNQNDFKLNRNNTFKTIFQI